MGTLLDVLEFFWKDIERFESHYPSYTTYITYLYREQVLFESNFNVTVNTGCRVEINACSSAVHTGLFAVFNYYAIQDKRMSTCISFHSNLDFFLDIYFFSYFLVDLHDYFPIYMYLVSTKTSPYFFQRFSVLSCCNIIFVSKI